MNQIDQLHASGLVRNANQTASWHNPHKVRVLDLEPPLVRHANREWTEWCMLARFSNLLCRHTITITSGIQSVEGGGGDAAIPVLRILERSEFRL